MDTGTHPSQITHVTGLIHVSLASATPHGGEPGVPWNPESYPDPKALAPFQFISFVVERLGHSAGSVLALMLEPLSLCCVSAIPAMSEPISGHSAEAFEGVIGL